MGNYSVLIVGDYAFRLKYDVPYPWCMLFNESDKIESEDEYGQVNYYYHNVFVATAQDLIQRAKVAGLNLDELEKKLELLTGVDALIWKKYRRYVIDPDKEKLHRQLLTDGYDEDDDTSYPNLNLHIEIMTDSEGLYDIAGLYWLLVALENVDSREEVVLDLSDLEFQGNPLVEVKQEFVDKVTTYNFLFKNTINTSDQIALIRKKIQKLDENSFIDLVLIPLLQYMGYQNVKRVLHHGPNEFGQDIRLFYKVDEFGRRIYYGAQVKAVKISSTANDIRGNVAAICNQLDAALNIEFTDDEDNVNKKIDIMMLITSKQINDNAKIFLHNKYPNRQLLVLDGSKISELVNKYNMTEKILGIEG